MMEVIYLAHSGFAVDTPSAILVFDFYKDPARKLQGILDANREKPVLFFVSHSHFDHFNPAIFNMAQNHKRQYIISNEVVFERSRHSDAPIQSVSPGDVVENLLGDIRVKAYGSTDAGVSFLATLPDGTTIFHAGDLNYWHWANEASVDQVKKAYMKFIREIQRIRDDVDSIDMAFFPVDPRLGDEYATGARIFLENIDVRYFFPMHFGQNHAAACDFPRYTTDNTESFCLYTPGRSVRVSNSLTPA